MAKIEKGPHGDCATEGGSEWRKDAGDVLEKSVYDWWM